MSSDPDHAVRSSGPSRGESSRSNLRVLLADDHPVVREGLKALVDAQMDMKVVGEASDGTHAWELTREIEPDVAVLDVSMPGITGTEAAVRIHRDCPGVKVLALTIHAAQGYLRQMLEAGASGYVLKQTASGELVRAIRAVAAGGVYLDPSLAGSVVNEFVRSDPRNENHESLLTTRETEVVRLLAMGHINREIAQKLGLSIKTVEVHKARALEKLGLRSRAALVQYAVGQGWFREI